MINAQRWLKYEKDPIGPLSIKFDHMKNSKIPLYEILRYIDLNITDFYKNNLNNIDENENFGDEIEDLFYFTKFKNDGRYMYHLFPKLDLKLLENTDLMLTFNRKDHIEYALKLIEDS